MTTNHFGLVRLTLFNEDKSLSEYKGPAFDC